MLRRSTLLEQADLVPEWVLDALREPVNGATADKVVRHLLDVATEKGWLRAGSQSMAFWFDYARNCFMLSVTHMDLEETPEGNQFPEIDMVRGHESVWSGGQ